MLQLLIVPECQETLQQSTHMSVSMQDLKAHQIPKCKTKQAISIIFELTLRQFPYTTFQLAYFTTIKT